MDLTLTDVERLMTQFEQSDLREFHLNAAQVTLTLSKNEWHGNVGTPTMPQAQENMPQVPMVSQTDTVNESANNEELANIKAELVGTVHLQPSPDAEPFVTVGQTIQAGEQVAIIEAMKLMTPVISPISGTIQTICVTNNDVVAYNDVLFEVTPMEA